MRKSLYILAFAAVLFASCGKGYDTKSHVKQFISENMYLDGYDVLAWSNVESTFHVSDSALYAMRQLAVKNHIVKAGTKYSPRTEKLNMISIRYKLKDDTLMNTFYLDDKLTGIVGVK